MVGLSQVSIRQGHEQERQGQQEEQSWGEGRERDRTAHAMGWRQDPERAGIEAGLWQSVWLGWQHELKSHWAK